MRRTKQRRGVLPEAPRRMLNLQPLITRLVDDILRAVRVATLDELCDPSTPKTADAPARARRKAAAPRTVPAQRRARPVRPRDQPVRREPAADVPAASVPAETPAPPELAEITDPDLLLSRATVANGNLACHEPALNMTEEAPPPSTVRPSAGPTAALRAGESLARVAGVGLVIRRPKRV